MPNFKPDNIRQRKFLDIDFLEVIGDDTFEYCLYVLLERESSCIRTETPAARHPLRLLAWYYVESCD